MALVSLPIVKGHLRLPEIDYPNDADIALKLDWASAVVIDYLKGRADPSWTETTAPGPVQLATCLFVAHYYEHRGDDPETDAALWMAVERLLVRFRDPALA